MKKLELKLFDAIENNNLSIIEEMVEADSVDINCINTSTYICKETKVTHTRNKGWTPLLLSLSLRRDKISQYLIESGASITDKLTDGRGFEYFDKTRKYADGIIKLSDFEKA